MSHTLTEVPTRGQAVTVPDPADARTATSVIAGFQPLANRVAYLEGHAMGASDSSSACAIEGAQVDALFGGTWVYTGGFWLQTDVSAAAKLYIPIFVPPNVTLATVTANLSGNQLSGAGAHAGLPATKPTLTLKTSNPGTDTATTLGTVVASATDGSASTAAYDAAHAITILPAAAITPGNRYVVVLTGETGANASANHVAFYGLTLIWAHP